MEGARHFGNNLNILMNPKEHITQLVEGYKIAFPDEYKLVKEAVEMNRKLNDGKFAMLDGSKDTRALYEISETLQTVLIMNMTEEETKWFKSLEGGRWFANTFKEFALPSSI